MKLCDDDGEPEADRSPRDSGRRSRADVGFDRWLTDRLHSIYDAVLKEEVPDELESLLDRFARRPPGEPKKP